MASLSFSAALKPVGKARPRFDSRHGVTYTPTATRNYEGQLALMARKALGKRPKLKGELTVTMGFNYAAPKSWTKKQMAELAAAGALPKTTKPDVDNLVKAVLDALNGVVYEDDAAVVRVYATKWWSVVDSVEISVEEGLQ